MVVDVRPEGMPAGWDDPSVLSRLLLYGNGNTRRAMADEIGAGSVELVDLLASTARSQESLTLRARCLEVLGLALATADAEVARRIIDALLGAPTRAEVPSDVRDWVGAGDRVG